jgi:hypothetical protein
VYPFVSVHGFGKLCRPVVVEVALRKIQTQQSEEKIEQVKQQS